MKQEVVVIEKAGKKIIKREWLESGDLAVVIKAMGKGDYVVEVKVRAKKDEIKGEVKIVGIVGGGAKVKVRGLVQVGKGIKGVEMRLEMRMVLMDKKSWVEVEPNMEIVTEEVKASHAATVGTVSKEELFYLMSRGLSQKEAEKLWLKGWMEKIVKTINREEDKERVVKLLSGFNKERKLR